MSDFDIDERIRKANKLIAELDEVIDSISCCVDQDGLLCDEDLKQIILRSIRSYEWDAGLEGNTTFKDNKEKREAYFRGVKSGYNSSLFWLCDALNMIDFFEGSIGHGFNRLERKDNGQTEG